MQIPDDPLAGDGLCGFANRLRRGDITSESATTAYLARIDRLDPKIAAFHTVLAEQALATARAMDGLLRAGVDLGPLMGVPIAVKEIFAIDGVPAGAGSTLDLEFLKLAEGSFVRKLKRAGCVILGTTNTTEFAAATINIDKPMPWNPADDRIKRVCGGSSHGSAAALRAGLCAFSIGSDTGGSVRLPAALCGVFGYKSSVGLWSTDGVFPLSPSMDSIGFFARYADDAALIFNAIENRSAATPPRPRALRLGQPRRTFQDNCDPPVLAGFDRALKKLRAAEIEVFEVELPDIGAAMPVFATLLFTEFAALMGKQRLEAGRSAIDRIPWSRIEGAIGASAESLVDVQKIQSAAVKDGLIPLDMDALLLPTAPFQACPADDVRSFEAAAAWNLRSGQYTRPANFYGLCGTTIPIQNETELPIGLQIVAPAGADADLLAMSQTIEAALRTCVQ